MSDQHSLEALDITTFSDQFATFDRRSFEAGQGAIAFFLTSLQDERVEKGYLFSIFHRKPELYDAIDEKEKLRLIFKFLSDSTIEFTIEGFKKIGDDSNLSFKKSATDIILYGSNRDVMDIYDKIVEVYFKLCRVVEYLLSSEV